MDAKAAAKSKRAHSLHAKRAHSHHRPKNPVTSTVPAGSPKKPHKEKTSDNAQQSKILDSNWDRYEEDQGFGDVIHTNLRADSKQVVDVPAPKSKGADFRHLISQAREEASVRLNPQFGCFDSPNDAFSDFYTGAVSMLSVSAEGLLSWSANDDFIVDDSVPSSFEVPYLSMDLDALNRQLEKLDVPERLFIENDLFIEELGKPLRDLNTLKQKDGEVLHLAGESSAKIGHGETSDAVGTHVALENHGRNREPMPSPSTSGHDSRVPDERSFPCFSGNGSELDPAPDSMLFHHNAMEDDLRVSSQPNATTEELKEKMTAEAELDALFDTMKEEKERKSLGFEASTAEAELDKLLDSFGQAKLLDSEVQIKASAPSTDKLFMGSSSAQPSKDMLDSYHAPSSFVLDNAIDDLLAQAPISRDRHEASLHPSGSLTSKNPPSSRPGLKALDDFDSWLDSL